MSDSGTLPCAKRAKTLPKDAKDSTKPKRDLTRPPAAGDNRCHYFVARKGRFCPFTTKNDSKYCGEHMAVRDSEAQAAASGATSQPTENTRVPCPYDLSHSVDLRKLKTHMSSRCNARPPAVRPDFVQPDCNVTLLPPAYEANTFEQSGMQWSEECLAKSDARLMVEPGEQRYLSLSSRVFGDLDTLGADKNHSDHEHRNGTAGQLDEAAVADLLKPVISSYLRKSSEFCSRDGLAPSEDRGASLEQLLEMVHPSGEFPTNICTHSVLEERTHSKVNPKHALQQASLLGHLAQRGLLDPKYAFLEFGAGKGELSIYVRAALEQRASGPTSIFLIDRKNFRMKFNIDENDEEDDGRNTDSKQAIASKPQDRFQRIYIDIRDLDLSKIEELQAVDSVSGEAKLRPVVAYSKHLCGAATDLTIKCLENYQRAGGQVAGVAIALCCHQVCKYSMFVDHSYLLQAIPSKTCGGGWDNGQREAFYHLTSMSSWAINSPRPKQQEQDQHKTVDGSDVELGHYSRLSYSQRVRAGHAIKRFLDIGRALYVRRTLRMVDAELVYYTSRDTSPENLALVATNLY
ncbi:DUF715-domain-containing protein [Martensiomyces pterosporus]|nr:DUF715-domain-containing protein [Martensiomyces pterosporus]